MVPGPRLRRFRTLFGSQLLPIWPNLVHRVQIETRRTPLARAVTLTAPSKKIPSCIVSSPLIYGEGGESAQKYGKLPNAKHAILGQLGRNLLVFGCILPVTLRRQLALSANKRLIILEGARSAAGNRPEFFSSRPRSPA